MRLHNTYGREINRFEHIHNAFTVFVSEWVSECMCIGWKALVRHFPYKPSMAINNKPAPDEERKNEKKYVKRKYIYDATHKKREEYDV